MTLSSSPQSIALDQLWDVVVIGAGVAGTATAIELGRHGVRTLLVEAKAFPRDKVCGGCLNQRAQSSLDRLGVLEELHTTGAQPIHRIAFSTSRTSVNWSLPPLLSVGRAHLDTLMVQRAIQTGVHFLPQTVARIQSISPTQKNSSEGLEEEGFRRVELRLRDQPTITIQSKCVVAADGLTRSSQQKIDIPGEVSSKARIGVQTLLSKECWRYGDDRQLTMAIGKHGYVGICAIEGNRWDVAAAIDPRSLSVNSRAANVVSGILEECSLPNIPALFESQWLATPALTRSTDRVADHRLFLVGDAVGYIEPFTGEGMSWALQTAELVVPLILQGLKKWDGSLLREWEKVLRKNVRQRQWLCHMLSTTTRTPWLAGMLIKFCKSFPFVRDEFLRRAVQ